MGVQVQYNELEELVSHLRSIVDEFEHAGSRRRSLQNAVGQPYGESALSDAAGEFESRWDDRRKNLMENCKGLADRAADVVAGFQDFDAEAAAAFDEPEDA
ncbi:MAG: flagellar protein FlgN [Propioniciclava sp.]